MFEIVIKEYTPLKIRSFQNFFIRKGKTMPATKKTSRKVTTKTAAKKAVVSNKVDDKKITACACDVAKQCNAPAGKKTTRVIAKFDAGWGNQLFIRGLGGGLDWNAGVPMQCIGEDEWLWEQAVSKGNVTFKVLVNDSQWSDGDDVVVAAGDTIICHPKF